MDRDEESTSTADAQTVGVTRGSVILKVCDAS